jgi:hypothetical protein
MTLRRLIAGIVTAILIVPVFTVLLRIATGGQLNIWYAIFGG